MFISGKPESQSAQKTGRYRHGGVAPQGRGAGVGERVDAGGGGARKKDPGAVLRRPSNREKTLLIDRLRPAHFARLDDVLARHRAEQLPLPPRQVRRRQVRRAARPGGRDVHRFQKHKSRYGYRRVKAALGADVSGEAVRRIMAEDGLAVHVPRRRRCSSYEGGTMPAPGNLRRPRFRRRSPEREMAHGHHAGLRLATGLCPRRDARPNRRIHPPVRPRTHQTVTGLDESGTISSKPRNDCMTISEKTSAPQQAARQNRIQEKKMHFLKYLLTFLSIYSPSHLISTFDATTYSVVIIIFLVSCPTVAIT